MKIILLLYVDCTDKYPGKPTEIVVVRSKSTPNVPSNKNNSFMTLFVKIFNCLPINIGKHYELNVSCLLNATNT